jgi:hypothetical protein
MHFLRIFLLFLLLAAPFAGQAQKVNAGYQLAIKKASSPIQIDGVMDEVAWLEADVAKDFYMVLPMDTSYAKTHTEVRMTYDGDHLYLLATCYNDLPGGYIVESLRRDFSFGKNDNFLLFMDTFDDQTNGFSFGANAAGAQWDGLQAEGGRVNLSWDNKWQSAVKYTDQHWIFEAAIPFKTIRYKKGITRWGVNFSRLELKRNEKSVWAPVPRQFPTATLAYTGTLIWDHPPPEAGANISIIPYLAGGYQRTNTDPVATERQLDVGFDAKVAITSSLNLDLTVNPDFSQVEVDRQQTNLSRFELFFPERRQFFLENADLFAGLGNNDIRPFFSRRIGLGTPILAGARLSGKLDKNWRIGAMNMQTDKVEDRNEPGYNYSVFALQRQVFARSNVSAFFINKQATDFNNKAEAAGFSRYNRTAGLEYNLASSDNVWTGKFFAHKTFSPEQPNGTHAASAELNYEQRNLSISTQWSSVARNFNAEVGFVPRTAFVVGSTEAEWLFFTNESKANIVSHGPGAGSVIYWNTMGDLTDSEHYMYYNINTLRQASFGPWLAHSLIQLQAPFDPTNSGRDSLATGSVHEWWEYGFEYNTGPNNLFTMEAEGSFGGYFANGRRLGLAGELNYRFQPYASIALLLDYNHIEMPKPYGNATFWLIGPRLDVTFTKNIFLTAFAQYNQQADNVNLNARFQWRYKPASDLFIVYTDNYFPENFASKSRALVLKFTYWWNI